MLRWEYCGQSPTVGDEATESAKTDEKATRTSNDTTKENSSEEAKLRAYDTLSNEIQSAVDRQVTLNTRGVGAMILIIGYSINFEQLAVLAFVPVIFSYLLVRTAESRAWMANAGGQITKIEQEIATDPVEDSFGFHHQLGFCSKDIRGIRSSRDAPAAIRVVFVAGVYTVTIFTVLYVVWPLSKTPNLLTVEITRSVLAAVYGVLTFFVVISAASVILFEIFLEKKILSEEDRLDG